MICENCNRYKKAIDDIKDEIIRLKKEASSEARKSKNEYQEIEADARYTAFNDVLKIISSC